MLSYGLSHRLSFTALGGNSLGGAEEDSFCEATGERHDVLRDCSLGASWAFPFQQVLLPDNRPRLPSVGWKLGQDLVAVT